MIKNMYDRMKDISNVSKKGVGEDYLLKGNPLLIHRSKGRVWISLPTTI